MPIGAQTKINLNIPQLTLAKVTQSCRHQSRTKEVPGSIPTGGNFLLNLFPTEAFIANIANLYNKGNTPLALFSTVFFKK